MTSIDRLGFTAPQRSGNDAIYGTGIDGNVTISTNTTLTSDAYYNNLTVNSGVLLNTNGFRVFVKGTLTLNGFIGLGLISGGNPVPPSVSASAGTVMGHTSGVITYRIGGQGGGGTATTLPSFLFKDINVMSRGLFYDATTGQATPLNGGSRGASGNSGATLPALTNSDTWPGKAGAEGQLGAATGSNGWANPYRNDVGVPGGKGNPGAAGTVTGWVDGVPGAGGAGGHGGGVVCVVARTIVGSGKIISIGRSGNAGSAGTTGTKGQDGADGSPAPNRAYHIPPNTHSNPATHNPGHHHGAAIFSDFHAHGSNPHPHVPAGHYGGDKINPASHHGAYNYNSGHYHHNGSRHHPHSNDHHGGMHYYYPSGYSGSYYKANHAYQHSHPATYGHFHGRIEHLHAGGHDGHVHAGHGHPGHTHGHANGHDLGNGVNQGGGMQHSGGHHHGPHHYSNGVMDAARHSHHANPNTVINYPDGHWAGGAGGDNDGINYGAGAPARTAPSGTAGSPGGGGAILVITDSVSGTITYDTSAGSLVSGGTAATNGSVYILVNS